MDPLDSESVRGCWSRREPFRKGCSESHRFSRIHTRGGKAPDGGCDASHSDTETKSSYTADYYFYAPAEKSGTP